MGKKQAKEKEAISKRRARREELRRKERQQRIIIIVAIILIAGVIIGVIAIPAMKKTGNQSAQFVRVTPVSYTTANGTTLGNPDSKVVIDVFEDFQCSACVVYTKEYEPQVIKEIVETGKAYYIFHHYPFEDDKSSGIKESDNAALASECAAEQNRFWDYKNILFANQNQVYGQFSNERLEAFAKSLGLEMNDFKACYQEKRYQDKLIEGVNLGTQMGVKGTPSVFVNGVIVSPGKVPTFENILQAVEKAATPTN
jgi:protein-disulfide isomerase